MADTANDSRTTGAEPTPEMIGGAAELGSASIDLLAHAGPAAVVVALLAVAAAPVIWLRRRHSCDG